MVNILRLAGYAARKRTERSGNIINLTAKHIIPEQKPRSFLVVSSTLVQGSKVVVICWHRLTDEMDVHGAFFRLRVAKAVKSGMNDILNRSIEREISSCDDVEYAQ